VFEQREGALKCLLDHKKKGTIGFTGISAHAVDVINLAAERDDIDVVFAIINMKGMGILRGNREEMEQAIERCFEKGKGVMLMKVLAGGNILKDYNQAMEYAKGISRGRAAIALGMVAEKEVTANVDYFNGADISEYLATVAGNTKNMLVFGSICKSCRKCADVCHSDAVSFESGPAVIDSSRCLKCGYCVTACPEFALRFV
jgi:ferredoxin